MFSRKDVGDVIDFLFTQASTSLEKDDHPHNGHDEKNREKSKTEPGT